MYGEVPQLVHFVCGRGGDLSNWRVGSPRAAGGVRSIAAPPAICARTGNAIGVPVHGMYSTKTWLGHGSGCTHNHSLCAEGGSHGRRTRPGAIRGRACRCEGAGGWWGGVGERQRGQLGGSSRMRVGVSAQEGQTEQKQAAGKQTVERQEGGKQSRLAARLRRLACGPAAQ